MSSFSVVHDLLSGIENAPSGTAAFYLPGTLTAIVVYGDDQGNATTNPVTLDSNGRATVYLSQLARMIVQTTGAVTVVDTVINAGGDVTVVNTSAAFTGNTQKDINDAALTAFGGQDWRYVPATGAGGMLPKTWMTGVLRNVLAYASSTAPNVNDGVTPADSAIAAAVADVSAAGGGVVYFPPGTYLVSGAIAVTGKNGVSFKGAGSAVSVIKNSAGAGNVFTLTTCSGFFIEDIGVSHSSSSTGTAVSMSACSQLRIASVSITGHQIGIDCSGAAVANTEVRSVTITTTTNAASRCIRYNASGTSNGHFIYGGLLSAPTGNAMEFNGTTDEVAIVGVSFVIGASNPILFNASLTHDIYSIVGCPGLGSVGGISMGGASPASLYQAGNGITGYTTDVASGGTITPDLTRGADIRIRGTTTGVAYVINAPTPAFLVRSNYLTLHFFNNAGAPITGWTMNAAYHLSGGAISTVDGNHTALFLYWDFSAAVWRELTRSVTT